MTLNLQKIIIPLFAAVLPLLFTGCGDDKAADSSSQALAQLAFDEVNCNTQSNRITTQGDAQLTFTATITDQGTDTAWCTFANQNLSATAQVGSSLFVYLLPNRTNENRTATIEIAYSEGGYSATLRLTQTAYSVTADYDHSWGEQPAFQDGSNYVYKTYYTTVGGRGVRNYSVCYDYSTRVSRWVAYPVHNVYSTYGGYAAGNSGGRTDAWAYDDWVTAYSSTQNDFNYGNYVMTSKSVSLPAIAESAQQYILRGYGASGYDRGHMLASASRLATWTTNAQTFFPTNMMPQNSKLNQNIWANLETKERAWGGSGRSDTLWVVTGASFKNTATITNTNGPITLPSHCWKVMIRLRSGVTAKPLSECAASELKAIGFLFTNDASGAALTLNAASCSVSDIEQQTGFTFFRNLAPDVAAAVKAQHTPSDWGL